MFGSTHFLFMPIFSFSFLLFGARNQYLPDFRLSSFVEQGRKQNYVPLSVGLHPGQHRHFLSMHFAIFFVAVVVIERDRELEEQGNMVLREEKNSMEDFF